VGDSSSGRTSTRARSQVVQVSEEESLEMVPRMTWGRVLEACLESSERLARFFCLVRRACRLRADSTSRTEGLHSWAFREVAVAAAILEP
jgi:hypothetical protein